MVQGQEYILEEGVSDNDLQTEQQQIESRGKDEATWQDQEGNWQSGSLTDAVTNVPSQGTITLWSDVSLTGGITISKQLTIVSNDAQNPCTIKNTTQDTDDRKDRGRIFTITSGELWLQDIILDGGRTEGTVAYHPLICVNGQAAILRMLDGAVLQDAENMSERMCGGGINLRRGQLYMHGGSKITHCKARDGGGVEVNSSSAYNYAMFGLAGGNIEECEADNGGGIYVNIGMVQMMSGEITGNRATKEASESERNGGGGIYIAGESALAKRAAVLIRGGRIADNTAVSDGGGILVKGGAYTQLQMEGGTLEGNKAQCGGGISVIRGNLRLYSGTVTGNQASLYGGGILGSPNSLIELQGNPKVYDNIAKDTEDRFDNLYLDGREDDSPTEATAPISLVGALTDGVQLGMSRWVRPDEGGHPYREMIVPGYNTTTKSDYTITQGDLDRLCDDRLSSQKELYADNMEEYAFLLHEGKIVMVLAVDITLDRDKLSLKTAGETATLNAVVTPDNALIQDVIWSSSDETIATVDADGVVTAVSEGQAVITATTVSPYHASASCKVTVGEEEEEPSEPKPPQTPDKPENDKEESGGEDPGVSIPDAGGEDGNEENTVQPDPSQNNDSYAKSTRGGVQGTQAVQNQITQKSQPAQSVPAVQNIQTTKNPQTGSFILWMYAAAVLSALCMLILTFWRIKRKKRKRRER
ncbi:MAG: Ig-like domain-containing protein [Eubacterium sp.]|nr:Ig-like domain-containing protein [Eubacterium sp.]